MREILFRGKSVYKDSLSNKKVWYEGFLFEKSDDCDVMCISREPLSANDYSEILGDYVEVIPETVGQYTGLTDKNGVKIFEGDVISMPSYGGGKHKAVVYFKNGKFAVDGSNYSFKDICPKRMEVIGNIYDDHKPPKESD